MPNKLTKVLLLAISCCFSSVLSAQEKENKAKDSIPAGLVIEKEIVTRKPIDPLRPAKAAFYSAVLPGLGQAYNKKYWKIPIVYGALGTGIYFFTRNDKQYNRYRDAYKSRLAGLETDEFYFDSQGNKLTDPRISDDGLRRAQQLFRRNKEISLLVTIGLYALNIIDANVDAHLLQYNVDENLTLAPHYELNDIDQNNKFGLTLNFKF